MRKTILALLLTTPLLLTACTASDASIDDLTPISPPSDLSLGIYVHPDTGETYVCDKRGHNPHIDLNPNGCSDPMTYEEAQQVVGQGFIASLEEASRAVEEAQNQ